MSRDRTYCIKCSRRTGRIDAIRKDFIDWKCPKCNLYWATPVIHPDSIASSIEQHAFAALDQVTGEQGRNRFDDKLQARVDKQVKSSHECKHHLPASLCTICPTNFGVGRIGS